MTYQAKIPFCIYKKHFHIPQGVEYSNLTPVSLVLEFVVVDPEFTKMNLRWYCRSFLKRGILDENKCEEVKSDIYKWIRWHSRDSFTNADLV